MEDRRGRLNPVWKKKAPRGHGRRRDLGHNIYNGALLSRNVLVRDYLPKKGDSSAQACSRALLKLPVFVGRFIGWRLLWHFDQALPRPKGRMAGKRDGASNPSM